MNGLEINTEWGEVIKIGTGNRLALVAGPCVIESRQQCIEHAKKLKKITEDAGVALIFKASYDKANRSCLDSYRGPGLKEGLEILRRVRDEVRVPVLSDVHCRAEVGVAAEVLDVIQIPAFLCRQTDLLVAAGSTMKPVNIKKGQFLAPWDVKNAAEKIFSCGNRRVFITERGTTFGYNNLVSDMRSLVIIRGLGLPVIYDATHSVQLPGGLGRASGGQREFVVPLCRAAVAAGCDGIFLEVHINPEAALCDGPNMLQLETLPGLLDQITAIHSIVTNAIRAGSKLAQTDVI
jgi:2-dehydro-3-deoxyphosphooctonate aldolase (KDO 8-P synthase)